MTSTAKVEIRILLGGDGADQVFGGANSDLISAGLSDEDDDQDRLIALLANAKAGTHINASLLTNTADDDYEDILKSSAGPDELFATNDLISDTADEITDYLEDLDTNTYIIDTDDFFNELSTLLV